MIRTTLLRRGEGRAGDNDPVRRVTQYWTMEGELLFEVDPVRAMAPPTIGPPISALPSTAPGRITRY